MSRLELVDRAVYTLIDLGKRVDIVWLMVLQGRESMGFLRREEGLASYDTECRYFCVHLPLRLILARFIRLERFSNLDYYFCCCVRSSLLVGDHLVARGQSKLHDLIWL